MEKKILKYKPKKKYKSYTILFADLETIIDDDDKHQPVVICMVDQNDDANSFNSMDEYINYLINNNRKSITYFHNLGRFDSTFILNWIVKNKEKAGPIEIIERNNIIYQIILSKYSIIFRDSYLIIPLKLDDIGKTFNNNFKKDNFEYDNIKEIYEKDRELVVNLCINDCRVLKEGFLIFSDIIKNEFDIELFNQLTLPALSFNIFKHKFYDIDNTPICINTHIEDSFIRRSYVGGISEVFKPFLEDGYCYDANSLYPFAMKNYKYPIGSGRFVNGDIIDINNFIGFIECKIEVNKEINFLTYRDSERGLITPTGEWSGVYYHAEIKKAMELGYKVEFIKGYKYDKEGYIFKDFVEKLYYIRKNSKNKSLNSIAKLLLNSLYGRFGMKIFIESTKFISSDDIQTLKKTHDIKNIHYLGNDLYTVSCSKKSENEKELFKNSVNTETAVHIASAITSYARIYMYDFKNLEDNCCYYTDTDSIFLKKKLDDKYIGSELGEFKLEYEIKKAYFIAPKVYGVILKNDSNKIVIKGLKKMEYSHESILKMFEEIIFNNSYDELEVNRTNFFKRNLLKLTMYIQRLKLKFNFPFKKRIKLYDDKEVWIGTRSVKLKKYD